MAAFRGRGLDWIIDLTYISTSLAKQLVSQESEPDIRNGGVTTERNRNEKKNGSRRRHRRFREVS